MESYISVSIVDICFFSFETNSLKTMTLSTQYTNKHTLVQKMHTYIAETAYFIF